MKSMTVLVNHLAMAEIAPNVDVIRKQKAVPNFRLANQFPDRKTV